MNHDQIKSLFTERGLKATEQRKAVYAFLLKNHTPTSIKTIHTKLLKTGIDQATVYRVIRSFVDAELVKQIDLGDDQAYYEIVDEHDHHHVVCVSCKKIADFTGCDITPLISHALSQSGFVKITNHSLELFGLCQKCKK